MELAVAQDESCSGWEGRFESATQTELLTQLDGGGFLNEKGVGSAVDREPVEPVGANDTTQSLGSFEQEVGDTPALELVRD